MPETSDTQVSFFEKLLEAHEQASRKSGDPLERAFRIGGRSVLIRFAGAALVRSTTSALQHLAIEHTDNPDFTICCWDSDSTGVRVPSSPWSEEDYLARGEIRHFNSGRIQAHFNLDSCILNAIDLSRDIAVWWKRDAKNIPFYERAAPFRQIFHWWMRTNNLHLIHAAVVGTDEACVLLAGKGGLGKSTSAMTGIIDGMSYLADDYILLEGTLEETTEIKAHSIYCTAKIDASHLRNFPQLTEYVSNIEELDKEKAIVYLHEIFPERLVHNLPVGAILLPSVTGRRRTLVKASSTARCLMALAPSTIFQQAGAGSNDFAFLAGVVRRLPCFDLECGTDMARIPAAIRSVLMQGRL